MEASNWRKTWRPALRGSTALTSICFGTAFLLASPAGAACDDNTPANGTTVTCDAPVDLTGISGNADNVTVDVLTGGGIVVDNTDAIDLDDFATVTMQSGTVLTATGFGGIGMQLGDNADVMVAGTVQAEDNAIEVGNDSEVLLQAGGTITGLATDATGIEAGDNATITTEFGSTISTFGSLAQGFGAESHSIQVGDNADVTLGGDIFVDGKAAAVDAGTDLTLVLNENATIQSTNSPGGLDARAAVMFDYGANITIAGSITADGDAGGLAFDGTNSSAATPVSITVTGTGSIHTVDQEAIFLERPSSGGNPPPPFIVSITIEDGGSVVTDNDVAITEDVSQVLQSETLTSLLVAGHVETGVGGGLAVHLDLGADRLELHNSFSIVGDVTGGDGTDAFVLGGDLDGIFNAALLDGDGVDEGEQFLSFETFTKEDDSAWTLTGTNDETFAWEVVDGSLFVTGTLTGSSFNLSPGADPVLFGGGSTVDSFHAHDGATVSPGLTPGDIAMLNVVSGFTFDPGSTYRVDLDGTPVNDSLEGTGVATLNGGAIEVNAMPGPYANGELFTIVDVGTLAGGTFDTVSDNLFLFNFVDLYDVADGIVQLRADLEISPHAQTPNEMAAAGGLESVDLDDPALSQLQALLPFIDNAEDARVLLNGLSGEIYATNLLFTQQQGELFTRSIRHRGRVVGGSAGGGGMQGAEGEIQLASAALEQEGSPFTQVAQAGGMEEDGGVALWGGFIGQVSGFDGDGNATDADHWIAGAAVGVETGWQGDDLAGTVGLGLGYSRGGGDIGDDRDSEVDSNGYHIGVYGALTSGPFGLSAAASYAWVNSDVTRTLPFGLGETEGDVDSGVISTSLEATYAIPLSEGLSIAPLAGFDATWVSQDGFTESGAGPGLTGDDSDFSTYSSALGARLSGMFPVDGDVAAAWEVDAKWRHRFGDDLPTADLAFAAGSSTFEVAGPELGSDWAEVGAGLQIVSGSMSVGIRYDGEFGGNFDNHALSLTVGTSF